MKKSRHQKSDRTVLSRAGAVAVIAALSLAPLSGGEGTAFAETEPACGPLVEGVHQVSTANQLQAVGSGGPNPGVVCGLDADYQQVEVITLIENWTPIGLEGSTVSPFTGSFDGGGLKIRNLKIRVGQSVDTGLFARASNATLSDIHLENVDIEGSGNENLGSIVGDLRSEATLSDSSVSGTVKVVSEEGTSGGLVGELGGSVTSSELSGTIDVKGKFGVGGIVGYLNRGTVSDTHVSGTGTVTALAQAAGGIAGYHRGTLTDTSVSGTISVLGGAGADSIGGLVGFPFNSSTRIESSTVAAEVSVSGDSQVGGLVGDNAGATISTSRSGASVETSGADVGGLVGKNEGTITDSVATGEVTLTGVADNAGGLVGNNGGTITRSFASGPVTVTGLADNAGGLVGLNASSKTISYSYSTGSVESVGNNVGGFVGSNLGDINNSYSASSVTGQGSVGGFVGENATGADILQSFSAGVVDGQTDVGGFAGLNSGALTVNFWDTETSLINVSARDTNNAPNDVMGVTTALMRSIDSYTDSDFSEAAWAMVSATQFSAPLNNADPAPSPLISPTGPASEIWGIGPAVNGGYPFLWWQTESAFAEQTLQEDSAPESSAGVASSGAAEKRTGDAGIHLDLQASVGGLVAGSSVVIGGQGLAGGSQYSLVVRSTPQTLVSGTASALGNFSGRASLPALPAGSHTLTLTASAADGSTLTLVQSFTVAANGTFSAIGSPTGSQSGGLAATGISGLPGGMGLAGLALLLGVAMVVSARRYQRTV